MVDSHNVRRNCVVGLVRGAAVTVPMVTVAALFVTKGMTERAAFVVILVTVTAVLVATIGLYGRSNARLESDLLVFQNPLRGYVIPLVDIFEVESVRLWGSTYGVGIRRARGARRIVVVALREEDWQRMAGRVAAAKRIEHPPRET